MFEVFIKSGGIGVENIQYLEDGTIIIEGIAADTSRDIVGDMAAITFLEKLHNDLPGRPLYLNHNYNLPQAGRVLETRLLDNGNRLWAKAEVYPFDPAIRQGIMDGSLRFFSVGAVGTDVRYDVVGGKPTKIFKDGYGQELTITGVPINPCASFRVAKSFGENSEQDVYNFEDADTFRKSFASEFGVDPFEERSRIATSLEELFMNNYRKGQGGMVDPSMYPASGTANTNLNGVAAQGPSGQGGFGGDGQLKPVSLSELVRKCMGEARNEGEFDWLMQRELFLRGYTGGFERMNGSGANDHGAYPGMEGGSAALAKVISEAVVAGLVHAGESAPNYGTHPDDHRYLTDKLPKASVTQRGYDDEFVTTSANRGAKQHLGPVGQSADNMGVHPLDNEFLQAGLKQIPPAVKSRGYVNSGMTNVRKSWKDLTSDPQFIQKSMLSPYVGVMGQGENETEIECIWRLLHERTQTEPGSAFRKAFDETIVDLINLADFTNPYEEDRALLQLIIDDDVLGEAFHKCLNAPNSLYNEERRAQVEDEYEKAGKVPPQFAKKGDDEGEDDEKDGDDKDDKNPFAKKKGENPFAKKDDKKKDKKSDDDDESEDDDEDSDDDAKDDKDDDKGKKGKFPFGKSQEEFSKAITDNPLLEGLLNEVIEEYLENEQVNASQNGYVKGFTGGQEDYSAPSNAPHMDFLDNALRETLVFGQPQ